MKADPRFVGLSKDFWANVRTISESAGYTATPKSIISSSQGRSAKVPSLHEIELAFSKIGLTATHICISPSQPTPLGQLLVDYFEYRAQALRLQVEPNLMDYEEARQNFDKLYQALAPSCRIPLNKQSGDKKAPAFFTGMINMLIEANCKGLPCDYDPRHLTTITRGYKPLRTLTRRVDGAFPSTTNPIAIWEIKEYYYTTTFGSRVADAVYETLLDGMELEELAEHEQTKIKHYLMLDSHYTWWVCGLSYLCRILDLLHMGYVDEVLFGKEIFTVLPHLVKEWVAIATS